MKEVAVKATGRMQNEGGVRRAAEWDAHGWSEGQVQRRTITRSRAQ